MFNTLTNTLRNGSSRVVTSLTKVLLTVGFVAMTATLSTAAEINSLPVTSHTTNGANHNFAVSNVLSTETTAGSFFAVGKDDIRSRAPAVTADVDDVQARLSGRYGNPVVERFLKSTSAQTGVNLYLETNRLIDQRHLEPATYQDRVAKAIKNLMEAASNREFLRANGLSVTEAQVAGYREEMNRLLTGYPVKSASDAKNMLLWTMDISRRHLGLSQTAVATEYVFSATESLDKYSAFVPEDNARQPSASLEDHVVGIGVEIKPNDKGIEVVRALRGGPAADGGLKKGDIIETINGQKLEGQTLDYSADLIKGTEGSKVLLGVVRDGRPATLVTLIRRRVTLYSVSEVKMIDSAAKVGYVKLDKFTATSDAEMDEALWTLHRQGMKSLVIDLRGNPGGLLTAAVSISDKFLPNGKIVSTHGRTASDESAEIATYEKTWKTPMVVLVDGNSASASEIFAAAIQENGRGVIVGRKSYGKGTVQTHFPLSTVSGNLRLTTAKFYSPSGRAMAGQGVTPDVTVEKAPSDADFLTDKDADILKAIEVAKGTEVQTMAAGKGRTNGARG